MDKDLNGAQHSGSLSQRDVPSVIAQPGSPNLHSGLVMHIALQGCLKAGEIPYGLTADTGGHIRYLLELVEALSRRPEVQHQIIVTRAFEAPNLGPDYNCPQEPLSDNVTLWRCAGKTADYLPKEALWSELPAITEALVTRILEQGIRPQLIHAHYADAGVIARRVGAKLGVPYVFTAHSLGASKTQHLPAGEPVNKTLKRRIRYEEGAIEGAAWVVASSEHEAEVQYGQYRNHDKAKIRINPPGCNLQSFREPAPKAVLSEVDSTLRRFLRKPDLPCLLAIARPVTKKNLRALVKAYAEHPTLRHQANLVIFAGTRQQIEAGEPEARQVWLEMLQLIDDYDLYGHVAYPKQHELRHVPAIYQWAVRRRGVFVNPALNEPFGLTLLEAAASGLPVVATQEGGPVDIVRRCGHGLVVPPTDTGAIAEACHQILFDDVGWKRLSARGRRNIDYYTWSRHAQQYVKDMGLGESGLLPIRNHRGVTQILASDMDGTLLGDRGGLVSFTRWLSRNQHCLFVVATGRNVWEALSELRTWSAPLPDFLVADVGSSIYRIDHLGQPHQVSSWQQHLDKDWDRATCQRLLSQLEELRLQPAYTQSDYKLSYFIDSGTVPTGAIVKQVEQSLATAGVNARVVHSHGYLLDILPVAGGKAQAVEFLRQRFGVDAQRVVAAGDSGNDEDLLRYAAVGIAVANHSHELDGLRDCDTIYWARSGHANGILEGLHYATHQRTPSSNAVEQQQRQSGINVQGGTTGIEAGA